jgi:acyl carrier protein
MSVEISSEDSKSELAMRAELECKVAEIWQQLLGVKEIGNDDDFFDLGGDSLLVTQFVSRLSEMFPVELPLDSVYDKPTIANIARVLETLLLQKLNTISDKEASRLAALG